jgi:hypothetical protein
MTWVRANLRVLIVLVVLAAASIWYAFAFDWSDYQDSNPTRILDVPDGKQATLGPGTFSLSEVDVLEGDSPAGSGYGVAEGTDVVVVDVRVTPGHDPDPDAYLGCDVRLLAPSPDGERTWWPESFNPTTYPDGDPDVFGCNVARGTAFTYRQFFVVPAGGADDHTVEVTIPAELPRVLHLH